MLNNQYFDSNVIKAQVKIYPTLISIYLPKTPIVKNRSLSHNSVSELTKNSSPDETTEERSLRRTCKVISDYVLCNSFSMFATFTFAKNRTDISEKRHQLSTWLKNQQKRNNKFQYIAVPEFHKDGKSLHFHAVLANYTGRIAPAINPKTNRQIFQHGKPVYTLPEFRLGFTNLKYIDIVNDSRSKVAHYITKYIVKDMPTFKGKKRYFCSKGLKTPKILNNPTTWYENITPDWSIETDNGTIMRFNAGSHPIIDRLLRLYQ